MKNGSFLSGLADSGLGCFFQTILFILGIPIQIIIWAFLVLWIAITSVFLVFATLFVTIPGKIKVKRYRKRCGKLQRIFDADRYVAFKKFKELFGSGRVVKKYLSEHSERNGEEYWRYDFTAMVFEWESVAEAKLDDDECGFSLRVYAQGGEIRELDIYEY